MTAHSEDPPLTCPFCGGEATPSAIARARYTKDVIAKWNRRAVPVEPPGDTKPATIDEIVEAVERMIHGGTGIQFVQDREAWQHFIARLRASGAATGETQ